MTVQEYILRQEKLINTQKELINDLDSLISALKEKCELLENIIDSKDIKINSIIKYLSNEAKSIESSNEELAYRKALDDFKKYLLEED